jgi:hypothetical protein
MPGEVWLDFDSSELKANRKPLDSIHFVNFISYNPLNHLSYLLFCASIAVSLPHYTEFPMTYQYYTVFGQRVGAHIVCS